LLRDFNVQDDVRATDGRVLRRMMETYVATSVLDARVARELTAIRRQRADGWVPPRLDSMTVGSWQTTDSTGPAGRVVFLGYITSTAHSLGTLDLPVERWTVKLRWEGGRWKLVDQRQAWLSDAGPMGVPGHVGIKGMPAHVVFHDRARVRRS
jgi:hypothetical protein